MGLNVYFLTAVKRDVAGKRDDWERAVVAGATYRGGAFLFSLPLENDDRGGNICPKAKGPLSYNKAF